MPSDFVESSLEEIDVLFDEWDEQFGDVELDRDEIALEASSRLLGEIEQRQSALQRDPRFIAVFASNAALN